MNNQELRTNKQELISKYELIKNSFNFDTVATDGIISDLKRLDEPEKVKVSEEEEKFLKTFDFNCENDVTKALYNVSRVGWGYYLTDNNDIELKDLTEGFRNLENRKRLIKAILDGYEVEKEERYLVKVKGMNRINGCLANNKKLATWYFGISGNSKNHRTNHTRKELEEAGFGWVFDCPGIEIEEVE